MKRALIAISMLAFVATVAAQQAKDGGALFKQTCATCHGASLEGTTGLAPALKGDHWAKLGAEREYLPTVILYGLSGAITVNGQKFVGNMPSWASSLDDETIAAIATYLRSAQGASASYSAADIKALRKSAGNPSQSKALRTRILGQ
jgi:mono/diheme cytochrome c family protein